MTCQLTSGPRRMLSFDLASMESRLVSYKRRNAIPYLGPHRSPILGPTINPEYPMAVQAGSHSVHRSRSVGRSSAAAFLWLASQSYVHRHKVGGAFYCCSSDTVRLHWKKTCAIHKTPLYHTFNAPACFQGWPQPPKTKPGMVPVLEPKEFTFAPNCWRNCT